MSRPGPYFVETVGAEDKKRVVRLAQQAFQREARELGIRIRTTPLAESALLAAFDEGAVAIVRAAAETYAVPSNMFERMTRFGREELRAAILIRKGPVQ